MALKAGRPTARTEQHIEKAKTKLLDDENGSELSIRELTDKSHELQRRVKNLEDENAAMKLEFETLNSKLGDKEKPAPNMFWDMWRWWGWS